MKHIFIRARVQAADCTTRSSGKSLDRLSLRLHLLSDYMAAYLKRKLETLNMAVFRVRLTITGTSTLIPLICPDVLHAIYKFVRGQHLYVGKI